MKKIGIITIYDNNNYGNKLQNYATQEIIKSCNKFEVCTIKNKDINLNFVYKVKVKIKEIIKYCLKPIIKKLRPTISFKTLDKNYKKSTKLRLENFEKFDQLIDKTKKYEYMQKPNSKLNNEYDYFIAGSDQVWNPNFFNKPKNKIKPLFLLNFADDNKKISFAASFGISELPNEAEDEAKRAFNSFKAISVREEQGKKIIKNLTGREDIEVLLDPSMLLTTKEWDKVAKKPSQIKSDRKFILNYFLGNLSASRKEQINKIAKENDCYIINILDYKDPFYVCGPSEFLWLEKNAFLICTDSFHSSVFAILYNKPFVVFDREQKGMNNMGSRIDTLLSKFQLEDRRYNGKEITKENLEHDYTNAYKILEEEREKSKKFLEKALDIK